MATMSYLFIYLKLILQQLPIINKPSESELITNIKFTTGTGIFLWNGQPSMHKAWVLNAKW